MYNNNYGKQGSKSANENNGIGYGLFILLTITAIILISLVISLAVMTISDLSNNNNKGNDSNLNDDKQSSTTDDKSSANSDAINVGVGNTPLFPTQPSRNNYVIGQASDVKAIDSTNIKSQHSILVDISSYTSVAEKSADAKIYPASMTKVMTLLVACEHVTNLQKKLTVTDEIAKFAADNEGSGAGLKVGESYTVEDLLYLISYQSDTIASILIAEDIAGSEEEVSDKSL